MDIKFFLALILSIVMLIIWLLFNVIVIIHMRNTDKASKLYSQTKLQEDYDNFVDEYNNLIKTIKIDIGITILVSIILIFLFFLIFNL